MNGARISPPSARSQRSPVPGSCSGRRIVRSSRGLFAASGGLSGAFPQVRRLRGPAFQAGGAGSIPGTRSPGRSVFPQGRAREDPRGAHREGEDVVPQAVMRRHISGTGQPRLCACCNACGT